MIAVQDKCTKKNTNKIKVWEHLRKSEIIWNAWKDVLFKALSLKMGFEKSKKSEILTSL